jgi:hypothetical protein
MRKTYLLTSGIVGLGLAMSAMASSVVTDTTRPSLIADPCQTMTPQECQQVKQHLEQKWQQLTPEQKQQFKQGLQQQWQKLTPEQQQQIRHKFKEKWQSMTPEEKQTILKQFKQ